MPDCDHLIDELHAQARDQIDLALLAQAPPVAAMHLDLAVFDEEQARLAEKLCGERG